MSMLSRLFGRKQAEAPAEHASLRADRIDIHRGLDVQANSDIIAGYKFCATIQMRTPLRVLRRHGEVYQGISGKPPEIAREMWEGIWVPITCTFRDLGLDVDEPTFSIASDIGPIPPDGGDYLNFLLVLRGAAERSGDIEHRRLSVMAVLSHPVWRNSVDALGGIEAVLNRLFPPFLSTISRIPAKTAAALNDAGLASPNAIQAASDEQLQSFNGIGSGLLAALRARSSTAPEPRSRFADNVLR